MINTDTLVSAARRDVTVLAMSTTNSYKKKLLERVRHLISAPLSMIDCTTNFVTGLSSGVLSLATFGTQPWIYNFSLIHLDQAKMLLAAPYLYSLKAWAPNSKLVEPINIEDSSIDAISTQNSKPLISRDMDGFITHFVSSSLRKAARNYCNSTSKFKQHVISRLTYPLLAISSLITRIADLNIGIFAAGLSFITFGKFESINTLAYVALQITGIAHDLVFCAAKFFNPWAGELPIRENDNLSDEKFSSDMYSPITSTEMSSSISSYEERESSSRFSTTRTETPISPVNQVNYTRNPVSTPLYAAKNPSSLRNSFIISSSQDENSSNSSEIAANSLRSVKAPPTPPNTPNSTLNSTLIEEEHLPSPTNIEEVEVH